MAGNAEVLGTGCLRLIRNRLRGIGDELAVVVEQLSPNDLEWRPNESSNSAAWIVRHVCSALRQWVVSGIGGTREADGRGEGSPTLASPRELADMVRTCFAAAEAVLAALPPMQLAATQLVRGQPRSHLAVLINTISHASGHLGQVIYIAKARLGAGFKPWAG